MLVLHDDLLQDQHGIVTTHILALNCNAIPTLDHNATPTLDHNATPTFVRKEIPTFVRKEIPTFSVTKTIKWKSLKQDLTSGQNCNAFNGLYNQYNLIICVHFFPYLRLSST